MGGRGGWVSAGGSVHWVARSTVNWGEDLDQHPTADVVNTDKEDEVEDFL